MRKAVLKVRGKPSLRLRDKLLRSRKLVYSVKRYRKPFPSVIIPISLEYSVVQLVEVF